MGPIVANPWDFYIKPGLVGQDINQAESSNLKRFYAQGLSQIFSFKIREIKLGWTTMFNSLVKLRLKLRPETALNKLTD